MLSAPPNRLWVKDVEKPEILVPGPNCELPVISKTVWKCGFRWKILTSDGSPIEYSRQWKAASHGKVSRVSKCRIRPGGVHRGEDPPEVLVPFTSKVGFFDVG
jgi:hypothetical protein